MLKIATAALLAVSLAGIALRSTPEAAPQSPPPTTPPAAPANDNAGQQLALPAPPGVPGSFTVTYTGPVDRTGPIVTWSGTAVFMGDPNQLGNPGAFALPGTHLCWQTTSSPWGTGFTIYQNVNPSNPLAGLWWVQCGTKSGTTQGSPGALRDFWYGTISVN